MKFNYTFKFQHELVCEINFLNKIVELKFVIIREIRV